MVVSFGKMESDFFGLKISKKTSYAAGRRPAPQAEKINNGFYTTPPPS